MQDYYEILGVPKTASSAEIKKAFRRLAHKYHPDKVTGAGKKTAEEQFKKVAAAYEVLGDPQKRSNYDQFGTSGPSVFGGGQGGDFSGFHTSGADFEGFGDIFESLFKRSARPRPNQSQPGQDLEIRLQVSFRDAVFGTTTEFKLNRPQKCEKCQGTGVPPGAKITNCQTCQGTGEMRTTQQTIFGSLQQVVTCPNCQGAGKIPSQQCAECTGAGRIKTTTLLKVKIPAGIENGAVIRLAGQGAAGLRGGPAGDLFVQVQVASDPKFARRGSEIFSTEKIPLTLAVLGGETQIETLAGQVKLKIPAGTQAYQVFKLKGHGVRRLSSSETGDHFVKILIEIPCTLSRTEKKLWTELQKEGQNKKKGFFS